MPPHESERILGERVLREMQEEAKLKKERELDAALAKVRDRALEMYDRAKERAQEKADDL